MGDEVAIVIREGVATITIDRRRVRNAIDAAAAQAISDALDVLESRADLHVGVLTGAGGSFSAGMDLKAFSASGERPITESRGAFGIAERPPTKPLIAAVEGHALGGGFEIALACDLIVAAQDAVFGLPEVRRGLVAAAGGAIRLPRRIPSAIAKELVLTGETLSAARAHTLGLVSRVVGPGCALEAALEMAMTIAANAPLAVQAAKRLIDESPSWLPEEAFARQRSIIQGVRDSEDAREGALAFVEKRPAIWKGR